MKMMTYYVAQERGKGERSVPVNLCRNKVSILHYSSDLHVSWSRAAQSKFKGRIHLTCIPLPFVTSFAVVIICPVIVISPREELQ